MKKPVRSDAHGKALKEAKLFKGTYSQLRSFIRSRFSYWLERMGI